MVKRFAMGSIALILMVVLGIIFWYFNRPLPTEVINQPLYEGVAYTRLVEADVPRITHIISVDLNHPEIRFFTTPADDIPNFDYGARTTSAFLDEFNLQVAINGDFFDPWYSYSPFDYYPRTGEGVNARGLTINEGEIVASGYAPEYSETLYITADNQATFASPNLPIMTAISGNVLVIEAGQYAIEGDSAFLNNRHPRTAIALNQAEDTLMLIVVDGRQHNYSHGATMPELAEIIIAQGGYIALNLDGGGSTSLVIEGDNNQPRLLNSAIHTRIPFRERPIANHFGVYAIPLRP